MVSRNSVAVRKQGTSTLQHMYTHIKAQPPEGTHSVPHHTRIFRAGFAPCALEGDGFGGAPKGAGFELVHRKARKSWNDLGLLIEYFRAVPFNFPDFLEFLIAIVVTISSLSTPKDLIPRNS